MINKNKDLDINPYIDKLRLLGVFIHDIENGIAYPNKLWKDLGYTDQEMINLGFLDYVHPDDHGRIVESLSKFFNTKDNLQRLFYRIKNKEGHWRWILSSSVGVEFDKKGNLTKYFGHDIDITQDVEAQNKVTRALREAETLMAANEVITSQLDLPHTINAILEQANQVFPFTSASVQLLDEGELEIVGAVGLRQEELNKKIRFPVNNKRPNYIVLNEKKTQIVNTDLLNKHPDFQDQSEKGIKSWMGVPLIYKGKLTGMMSFDHSEENMFSHDDIKFVNAFGQQVAIAIENSRLYERTKELAIRDALTGCYSRRHLFEVLERESDHSKRYNENLAIIMFDLDDFKSVNDTHGHLTGDEVLKRTVELANSCLRKSDILCRYGGEEFVIILPKSTKKQAEKVAERIRSTIESALSTPPVKTPLTVSMGNTTFNITDHDDVDHFLNRADKALYQAKKNGKNQVVYM